MLKWKKVGKDYEAVSKNKKYDFVISTAKPMILIIFDYKIKDSDEAVIETFDIETIAEGKKIAEDYK